MNSCFFFTLIWSCLSLKFNSNYETNLQSRVHVELGPSDEANDGHSSWSLGGGGCHSVFAQQGFVRGFRNALTSEGVSHNYPIYQVTVSGGGWFWAGLLSYRKAFRVSENELYGMDGFGWLSLVESNCEPGVDDGCSLSGSKKIQLGKTGSGHGSGCGYFFDEGGYFFDEVQMSLLEQTSESSSRGNGLDACESESAVDSKCTRAQKISIFGPAATCAQSMGYVQALSTSWLEMTYKHYLEPNGLGWTDKWQDFGTLDSSEVSFNWRLAWSNYSSLQHNFRVAGCYAHHGLSWVNDEPNSVVLGVARSSDAPAAIMGSLAWYLKDRHCQGLNREYIEANSESFLETLRMLHDFIPNSLTFNKNAGEHWSTLLEIPYALTLGTTSDRAYSVCAAECENAGGDVSACKTGCENDHPFGFPTDNINDQTGFLNLLNTIEKMEEEGVTTGDGVVTNRHQLETWGPGGHAAPTTHTDGTDGQWGAFRVFPVLLMTACGLTSQSLVTSAFDLVRMYFAEAGPGPNQFVFLQSQVPPHALGLQHFLCEQGWLEDDNNMQGHANENHGVTIPPTSKFWGHAYGGSCASYMFKMEFPDDTPPAPPPAPENPPNPPQCDNLYAKLMRSGLIYAERIDVALNPKFDFGAIPWKIMAMALAVQMESDLSQQWLVFADPYAAMLAGPQFRQKAAKKLGVSGSGSGSGIGMFFAESELETHPAFREGDDVTGSDNWVLLNMANLRQSVQQDSGGYAAVSVGSFLLHHFPAFPATTLSFLPTKFAYILDNYMSHFSYVLQCCVNTWQSPLCVTAPPEMDAAVEPPCPTREDSCPFCHSHADLCPCDLLSAPAAAWQNTQWVADAEWLGPTVNFIFPVVRFGVQHSESR